MGRLINENKLFSFQTDRFNSQTCSIYVAYSKNADCTGKGRYIHPKMSIEVQCKKEYFVKGSRTAKCGDVPSCEICACDTIGSVGKDCDDHTGQCDCKPGSYGVKCQNRHCQVGFWENWGR